MKRSIADNLKLVRRYTGDRFSAAKGYDLRKPMSRARARTIEKYAALIDELTSRPHVLYKPKRGEKREAFAFTGQDKAPRFDTAIVAVPVADDKYTFAFDKTRPKGSRFTLINKRTKEKSYHIPAKYFLDENELLYDEDEDLDPEFFQYVLEQYAEQGPRYSYVIEAGEWHMWGASGDIPRVSRELSSLFKQYGAGNFDPFDKNSHFIGNWFRGVQVYTNPEELAVYALQRAKARGEYNRKTGIPPFTKYRALKSGDVGIFVRGKLTQTVRPTSRRAHIYRCATCNRGFETLKRLTRHRRETGHSG